MAAQPLTMPPQPHTQQNEGPADFTARPYQLELFEQARDRNCILVLGTGSGKTFISILLIKELAHEIRGSLAEGSKRTVFVVNTVPLVYQQAEAIKDHTDLAVGKYEGSMNVDFWTDEQWHKELEEHEVLVMVDKIFHDLILHARLPLSSVNLLIVDECHHATGNHPMREIMREMERVRAAGRETCPHVLGLTACVIQKKCKGHQVPNIMRNLEAAMCSALVTSVDVEEVLRHSTRPQEDFVCYHVDQSTHYQDTILAQLQVILSEVEEQEDVHPKFQKAIKKKFVNVQYLMKELGDWCVARAIKFEIDHFETSEEMEEVPVVRELIQLIRERLQEVYNHCQLQEMTMGNPLQHVSKKVLRLVEQLRVCGPQVYGLVFVERRNAAKILYDLLLAVAAHNPDLSFVKPQYVVGSNNLYTVDINLAKLELRKQKETLDKFRSGQCNYVVSTSVLEEGVDIRKCNVVIRFNKPGNYRAYVQSRGRARAVPSQYILFVEEGELGKLVEAVEVYRQIERQLRLTCHNRLLPSHTETRDHFSEDEHIRPYMPYGPTGPKVTGNSAIPLVNVYCGKLPHDKFTEPAAEVRFRRKKLQERTMDQATIVLPINSSLRDHISGDWMENKELAKKSAAMQVCRRLHAMGELDQDLRPTEQIDQSMMDLVGEQEEVGTGPQPGTRKRRQLYQRQVCRALTPHHHQGRHQLYAVQITHKQRGTSEDISLDSTEAGVSVGLVSKGDIVHCPFPLYFNKWGEVEVRLKTLGHLPACSDLLLRVQHFHKLALDCVLKINTSLMEYCQEEAGVYVVPLKGDQLDRGLLDQVFALPSLRAPTCCPQNNSCFDRSLFQDAILIPVYDTTTMYYVTEINEHISPISPFPDQSKVYKTYVDYYLQCYNLTIKNKQQPLVTTKHVFKELCYLKKNDQKKSKKTGREPPKLVPELCWVLPLRAPLWWQLMCVPSVLCRLNAFGLAHQLNAALNPKCHITQDYQQIAMSFAWTEKTVKYIMAGKEGLEENLSVLMERRNTPHILPFILVHALTLAAANDNFDLERLEVLGDAFLKFSVSKHIFLKYPDVHEGKLTLYRTQIISNKTLYSLAKAKGLPGKIQALCLVPQKNGLMPGYTVRPEAAKALESMQAPAHMWSSYTDQASFRQDVEEMKEIPGGQQTCCNPWQQQQVSDKSVADCVEAVIGAYLLWCGRSSAIAFLHNLGLGVVKGESLLLEERSVRTALLSKEPWAPKEVSKLYRSDCLDRLECKLGYTFRDKTFLLQAVTHSSYCKAKVTDCYQRLEFLGDAVLDYLVTGFIYSRHNSYDPGQLSDLRSYYVKNEMLAQVAVRKGLHLYLLHMAPKLQASIDGFRQLQANADDGDNVEDLNTEFDDIAPEDVEVPKVLGDLVEAIIGAVYLDSGCSLQTSWRVVVQLMGRELCKPLDAIPINEVRRLYEKCPGRVTFTKLPREEDDKVSRCMLEIDGLWTLVGTGKNHRVAKIAAAKLALKKLQDT